MNFHFNQLLSFSILNVEMKFENFIYFKLFCVLFFVIINILQPTVIVLKIRLKLRPKNLRWVKYQIQTKFCLKTFKKYSDSKLCPSGIKFSSKHECKLDSQNKCFFSLLSHQNNASQERIPILISNQAFWFDHKL